MIKPQRRTHAWVWPVLGALLAAGIAAALAVRPGLMAGMPSAQGEAARSPASGARP